MRKIKIYVSASIFCAILFVSCGKPCEECECWKNGKIIDNYKHCSGNFSAKRDHKFYREYMKETYDLDSVICK